MYEKLNKEQEFLSQPVKSRKQRKSDMQHFAQVHILTDYYALAGTVQKPHNHRYISLLIKKLCINLVTNMAVLYTKNNKHSSHGTSFNLMHHTIIAFIKMPWHV